MLSLRNAIVELYARAATSLPSDVETALRRAFKKERKASRAGAALFAILENVRLARETGKPMCQDTGVPTFFIKAPFGLSHLKLKEAVSAATRIATKQIPLRPN